MRLPVAVFLLALASEAEAKCGKLCVPAWWETATLADVRTELNAGMDATAKGVLELTPLHYAASLNTSSVVEAILDAGADVMARDEYGSTPLHEAAVSGSSANIKILLDAGADPKAKDDLNKRPWVYAEFNKKLKDTTDYWPLWTRTFD
jgi:ankyrin repeat protein